MQAELTPNATENIRQGGKRRVPYWSSGAERVAEEVMAAIAEHALAASEQLAHERGPFMVARCWALRGLRSPR